VLAPLAVEDLRQLMADTLHAQVEHVHALAALVHEKTGGNPFFAIQFVATLAEEGLLVFDRHRAEWWWEMDRIRAKGITDNLADFMAAKLSRLPNRTQTALGQLACLGNVAELATVAMAHGAPEEEMHTGLRDAVQTGLVFRTNGTYTFVHDRVREAAYALFPEEERVAAHLCLGRVLVSRTDPMLLDEKIFEIVDQLNRGAALIDSPQDREQLARLDLLAGKRAKTSTAYDSALAYFAMGRDLLLSDRRDATHRLSFELELQMAECEFMTGELTTAEERLLALRAHAADVGQLADVVCLALLLYFTTGRSERAAQISFEFLERVGITWSAHPTDEEVGEEYHRMLRKLERRPIETLVDLPAMSDPTCLATMNVLTGLFPAAFYVDRNLLELVLLRMTNISLKWGNGDGSSVAYAALNMVLGPRFGDYLTAYRFGQLACDLVDRRGLDRFKARVYSCVGSFSMPWTRPLPACRPLLRFAFDAGSAIGDLAFAAYTYRHLITNLLVSGEPLAAVQLEAEEALAFARKARLGLAAEHFIGQLPLIRALRGLAPEAASAADPAYSDAWGAPQLEKHPHLAMAVCFHWIFALQECFFRQDYAAGIEAADRAGTLLWSTRSCFEAAEYHFYGALTRAAVCDCAPEGQRERHLEALHNHYGQITGWAQNCPENFGNRAALIGAEIARLDGRDLDAMRLYEVAVASARERHVTQNEGLGNELAARFYAARGFETIAVTYRRSARSCYVRWGATGKVRQLDRLHPDLQEPPTLPGPTVTFGAPVDHLDVGTMFKASQALSGEIVLGKLIETLMRITVQHAGAERGVLILIRDGEPRIAAEAATCEGKVNVTLREETVSSQDLPESALHYVLRSRQSLILDDAMLSDICSGDEYVQQRRPKSVLCIPIIKQAGLVGALYLENNLTRRAFTPERITVLEFLAAQAAISLENACLYAGLQRSEAFLAEAQRMSSIGSWNWKIASGRAVWSAEHYRILGRDPGLEPFPSYRMFIEIVHPEDRAALEQKLQAAVRERARLAVDYRIVLADGTIKHLHSVGRPMVDESGEVRDYVGSTMDVSERKHAEDALRDAQAELAHVARLTTMGELAASIAHEVNQPLAAIVTNAESCLLWLAKERPDLDRVRKAAERIVRTGHHASDVIKSIRAMLRKGSPAISQLDLNGAITDVLDLMRNELSRHEVALETELCADLERITGDRVQLQQVIVNLVKNGIEALSGVLNRARLLRVTTTLDANGCVLTAVADSGKGLDAPTMSRIFEPFFTTRREGMGMGLSICRSIVEAHGGRLWASCRSPHGSVFQFTLPPPSESPFQTWNGNAPS
jgi:signal transduction histidine kinase